MDAHTVYVFNSGDLFVELFNIIAMFTKSNAYSALFSLAIAFGFALSVCAAIKVQDPKKILNWFCMYFLVFNGLVLPKVSVAVYDVSNQSTRVVQNVPIGVAFISEGLTGLGYALAQLFDMLYTKPDTLSYTKTGFLFGSRLIQESKNYRILDPALQANFSMYFRRCVVGDILLSRTLSPTELKESDNIWGAISRTPSPIRRTVIKNDDGTSADLSCVDAARLLNERLTKETIKVAKFVGINLFGRPNTDELTNTLSAHLNNAFGYYLHLENTATNMFLQAMMMNVIRDGIVNYQAYMNSSASVVNQAFIKSQAQQRYTWQLLGMKASWALPLLHSVLTFLILALFPLIIILVVAYGGSAMFKSVLQFFLSMQLWPALFAILNLAMTFVGKGISGQYEHFNLYSIDYLTELHSDIAGVAGFLSMSIPWLSFGVVGRLGETFNSLANSMSSSLQSATISSAQEAAGASFSLGQTSFYNATGNMLSANKHDSNFSAFSGSTIRQLESGATIATSADGNEVIDASSAVSRGTVSISSNNAISGMLNRAYENSLQSVSSHSRQLHGAISEGLQHLSQLSQMDAKDLRLGEGISESVSSHLLSSVSRLLGTAESVANKVGITREQALTGIVSAGIHSQFGINTKNSAWGKLGGFVFGTDGSLYVKGHAEKTDTTSDRYHTGMDKVLDAREVSDFRRDYNAVQNFTKTHHLDSSHSHGANLVAQTAGDLREAESVARSLDASLAQSERILTARSVTESGGTAISHNLDQMFQEYVKEQVGAETRNELYGHPGDAAAQAQLQTLANQFLQDEGMQQRIIDTFGNQSVNPLMHYQENSRAIASEDARLYQKYFSNQKMLERDGARLDVGVLSHDANSLRNKVQQGMSHVEHRIDNSTSSIADSLDVRRWLTQEGIKNGQHDASGAVIINEKFEKLKKWTTHENS